MKTEKISLLKPKTISLKLCLLSKSVSYTVLEAKILISGTEKQHL